MSARGGWRVAARWARRDLVRSKGRNLLVAAMVGLPVLLVSGFATVYQTDAVSPVESIGLEMGRAQASVQPIGRTPIDQDPWAEGWNHASDAAPDAGQPWSAAQVQEATGGTLIDVAMGRTSLHTTQGRLTPDLVTLDASDPRLHGMVDLRSGSLPRHDSEVLVSPALAARGYSVGDALDVGRPAVHVTITGIADVPLYPGSTLVIAAPAAGITVDGDQTHHYVLDRAAPVTWSEVRRLNQLGLLVTSRSVVQDPPSDWRSTLTRQDSFGNGSNSGERSVLILLVFSIALEVVLLAGPAFAVGVRRQRRQLALLAASGGTQQHVRRVVLVQALSTGALAAGTAALLGIPFAAAVMSVLVWVRPTTSLGPFDIAWIPLLAAFGLGALAALAAAFFPARSVARQDVVQVLAGRRGQVRSRRGLPLVGIVLLGAGAVMALTLGTKRGGETTVAVATLAMVLGAIAIVPALIGLVGRLAARLPLPLRLAARDSSRQRGRTAPAVAAVMAAVAGVTTLAIGAASDFAQRRAEYAPRLPAGVTTVQAGDIDPAWWTTAAQNVATVAPGRSLLSIGQLGDPQARSVETAVYVPPQGCPAEPPEQQHDGDERCLNWLQTGQSDPSGMYAAQSSLVASPEALRTLGYALDAERQSILARGGVLLPSRSLVDGTGHARLTTYSLNYGADTATASNVRTRRVLAGSLAAHRESGVLTLIGAVMTPQAARDLGVGWRQTGAVLSPGQPLSRDAQDRLEEKLNGSTQYADVYTERGFDESFGLPLIGLSLLAGLVVLVGTLTATGLALTDSRPDLATLAAVGARPRTRRVMAAAQALVIGLLGAGTGIAVGFVPGLAVTWPLTAARFDPQTGAQSWGSPTIAVPWLLLAVVGVAVPLIAASSAGLGVRSRLPLTRRLGQ